MDPERQRLFDLYRDLRVTDVADGLDMLGYQDIGLMDPAIRPLAGTLWASRIDSSGSRTRFGLYRRIIRSQRIRQTRCENSSATGIGSWLRARRWRSAP